MTVTFKLGVAEGKMFPPIRVSIVKEEGWNKWDPAGPISDWAADNAWDDWTNMDDSTCREYVGDLVSASMGKREQKKIGDEELDRICEYLKEEGWSGDLESTHHAIIDALTWMWEEAYTPDDGDIGSAMERGADDWSNDIKFGEHWNLIMGERALPRKGPKEWMPQVHKWRERVVIGELLKQVTYERKPGWYDRYIILDFAAAEPVKDLLEAADSENGRLEGRIRELEEELGRLGNTQEAEIRRDVIEDEIQERQDQIYELKEVSSKLKDEFQDWSKLYLRIFFRSLEKWMENEDPGQKADFRKHWKAVFSDKQRLKAVRKELLDFLKKPAGEVE